MQLRSALRSGEQRWRIGLLNGPNMTNLGRRPTEVFGRVPSLQDLEAGASAVAEALGVSLQTFASNHEGDIVEWLHHNSASLDGVLINPAGLTPFGLSTVHALEDSGLPVIEVHMANVARRGLTSLFTPSVVGTCHGMRRHSYHGALVGLVGMLDDQDFASPA
jgi:3-dehydroquinate dehydratase-2